MDVAGYVGHPSMGIVLYKDVWEKDANFIERLENCIGDSTHEYFSWKEALVGDLEKMPEYRDCSDFKFRETDLPVVDPAFEEAGEVYREVIAGVRTCLKHYTNLYNIEMQYEEATNFVKYGVGQHFGVHADHGFSYSATVSTIGYLNDDYEGGEYLMPYQDLKYTPEAGDLLVHPSTFVYAHQSLPVTKGTKYAAVTMYDYNDRNHQNHSSPVVQQPAMPMSEGQVTSASGE